MSRMLFFSSAAWPTSALAEAEAVRDVLALPVRVGREQLQRPAALVVALLLRP